VVIVLSPPASPAPAPAQPAALATPQPAVVSVNTSAVVLDMAVEGADAAGDAEEVTIGAVDPPRPAAPAAAPAQLAAAAPQHKQYNT
jgi:hypothetical protein